MKKVLFASTALIAFGGAAVADVSLSGRAEIGIFDTNAADVGVQLFSDIDVTFTMTGETDNGLTFGASIDLDEPGAFAPATEGGEEIFISGAFGTVTLGDTDGALDWALTDAGNIGNGGSIADDETSHVGYLGDFHDGLGGEEGQDGQILRWDYTSGAFGVAVSYEQGDTDGGGAGVPDETDGFAIGLRYNLDLAGADIALGLGYQSISAATDIDIIGVGATATLDNGLSAGFTYVDGDVLGIADSNHIGVGVGYTTGALTLHANYGQFDFGTGDESDGFGLSAAYDLGGGAVIHAGYGDGTVTAGGVSTDSSSFSLGLGLSF